MPELPDLSLYIEHLNRRTRGARLLADRALSRLLKDDWPKRIEDLE